MAPIPYGLGLVCHSVELSVSKIYEKLKLKLKVDIEIQLAVKWIEYIRHLCMKRMLLSGYFCLEWKQIKNTPLNIHLHNMIIFLGWMATPSFSPQSLSRF